MNEINVRYYELLCYLSRRRPALTFSPGQTTMNAAFREAAAQARQKPVKLSHNQEVRLLMCFVCCIFGTLDGGEHTG